MDKNAIKDLTYGGLLELVSNPRYYYHSVGGYSYSHFTNDGKDALDEFMQVMAWKMLEAEQTALDRRAKEQVIATLKGQ
jgi:hypothetical protein